MLIISNTLGTEKKMFLYLFKPIKKCYERYGKQL